MLVFFWFFFFLTVFLTVRVVQMAFFIHTSSLHLFVSLITFFTLFQFVQLLTNPCIKLQSRPRTVEPSLREKIVKKVGIEIYFQNEPIVKKF